MVRVVCLLLTVLAGCPSFAVPEQVACGAGGECPAGQRCEALLDVCVDETTPAVVGLAVDSYPVEIEAAVEAPPLTVRLVDAEGRTVPVSGGTFTLEATVPDVQLRGTTASGAEDGVVRFAGFQIDRPGGPLVLRVRGQELSATTGSFTVRPTTPVLELESVVATSHGCQQVGYRLSQAQGLPVDLVVEMDPDGSGPADFRLATQGASAPGGSGFMALPTSAQAQARIYTWDATTDVPGVDVEAVLRFTTRLAGRRGPAVSTPVALHHAGVSTRCRRLDLPLVGSSLGRETSPDGLALVDLDLDGHLDLLGFAGGLELGRGRGDGSFEPAEPLVSSVEMPNRALVADLDLDGAADVVLGSTGSVSLALLWNDPGLPAALSEVPLVPGEATAPVAVGDVDGDGWPDLILLTEERIEVRRHVTGEPRSFASRQFVPEGAEEEELKCFDNCRVQLVDVEGDGLPEVLLHGGRRLFVHPQDPRQPGTFLAGVALPLDVDDLVGVADLFDDARPEVVLRETSTGGAPERYLVLAGDGDGGLGLRWELRTAQHTESDLLADLNGDGRADLVIDPEAKSAVPGWIDLVEAERSPWSPEPRALSAPAPFAATDLDGDGQAELLGVVGRRVLVARAAAGTAGAGGAREVHELIGFRELRVADLTGEGLPDLVGEVDGSVYLAAQTGPGPRLTLHLLASGEALLGLLDAEDDGPSLVVTRTAEHVRVRRADGSEQASCAVAHPFDSAATGDVDGDGRIDLVYAHDTGVYLITSIAEVCTPPSLLYSSVSQGAPILLEPRLADLNRDGRLDVLASGGLFSFAWQTEEPGIFAAPTWSPPLDGIGYGGYGPVEVGDLDRDGWPDLLVSPFPVNSSARGLIYGYLADADGSLRPLGQLVVGNALRFSVVDVDGDGWLDVLEGGGVHLQHTGGGAFDWSRSLPARDGVAHLIDFDADGDQDLLLGVPHATEPLLIWPTRR